MFKNPELVAFLATLSAITLLGVAAAVAATYGDKDAASLAAGAATGLIGVLKMPVNAGGSNG